MKIISTCIIGSIKRRDIVIATTVIALVIGAFCGSSAAAPENRRLLLAQRDVNDEVSEEMIKEVERQLKETEKERDKQREIARRSYARFEELRNKRTFRPSAFARNLKIGVSGEDVEKWQIFLIARNFDLPVNGKFGPATQRATKIFQKKWKLYVDGVVGQKTMRRAKQLGYDRIVSTYVSSRQRR